MDERKANKGVCTKKLSWLQIQLMDVEFNWKSQKSTTTKKGLLYYIGDDSQGQWGLDPLKQPFTMVGQKKLKVNLIKVKKSTTTVRGFY